MRDIANLDSAMREHLGRQVWIRVVHPEVTSQRPKAKGKVLRRREIVEEYGTLRRFVFNGRGLMLTLVVGTVEAEIRVWDAEKHEWFVRPWTNVQGSVKPWSGLKDSGDIK